MPVWAELLADLETPVAAYAKLVGDGPGLPARVGRARRALEPLLVRRARSRWPRCCCATARSRSTGKLPVDVPTDRGILAALEHLLATYRAPVIPELPPLHGGLMGYLGYDVIREVERLPDVPHDDRHVPDAVMSMIGSLAAFDHWRQRVTLIESVPVLGLDADADRRRLRRRRSPSIERAVANLARPLPYVPVEPPEAGEALPDVKSSMPDGMYQQAVEVAKEHIVAGDIFQVVLAQRYDLELDADPFDVYRVLRQVNPSPYMYFLRHPELTIVGSSPEPMVQLLDGTVISRPIAGTRKRGETDEHDRRMAAELTEHPKERAEHVMLVDLARNDVGRVAEFGTRARRRADDARALQPRDAPHVAGVRRRCATGSARSTCCGRRCRPARSAGRRRCGRWRSSTSSSRSSAGPYAGVVGYVDWSGNLDTAIAIRTMFCAPTRHQPAGRRRHRRRLGPRRRGPRVPQQGGRPAGRHPRRPPDDRRPPRRRHARLTETRRGAAWRVHGSATRLGRCSCLERSGLIAGVGSADDWPLAPRRGARQGGATWPGRWAALDRADSRRRGVSR